MKKLSFILLFSLFLAGCTQEESNIKKTDKKEEFILISYYETKIYDKIPDRMTNINICANALNGYIINPGEEFSFNNVVGERTPQKGYKEAITYNEKGEKEMDFGGGICQISSGINMAVKKVGLPVTERHNHKHEVPYEILGNDAAVSYGSQDFKFLNNTDKEIKLEVIINNTESVIINIYKKGIK